MKSKIFLTVLLFALMQSNHAYSNKELKSQLLQIYQSHRLTFFCAQPFNNKGELITQSCENCPRIVERVEWMAIVSQSRLASDRLCFHEKLCVNKNGIRYKGLRCCELIDEQYQQMNKDIYNYVPEMRSLKKQHRNFRFGLISSNENLTQSCQLIVDMKNKIVEPAPSLRGMIARTYLYMRDTYHLALNNEELRLYQSWHQQYPVSEWERERNEKIKAIQGKGNPYVK